MEVLDEEVGVYILFKRKKKGYPAAIYLSRFDSLKLIECLYGIHMIGQDPTSLTLGVFKKE